MCVFISAKILANNHLVASFIVFVFNMVTLEEVRKIISENIAPIKAKVAEFETKIADLDNSYTFNGAKYDQLLNQAKSMEVKIQGLESQRIPLMN